MGCGESTGKGEGDIKQYNIHEEYKRMELPPLEGHEFNSEFEKEAYLTICVFRKEPALMLPHFKGVKGKDLLTSRQVHQESPSFG